jgi:hypothetical protein
MTFHQTKIISPTSHTFNRTLILGLLFVCLFALSGFYVFQLTEIARDRNIIQNHKLNIIELTQTNKNSEINFAQINSLESVETLVQNLNFEKIGKISYIRILEPAMAIK